MRPLRWLVHTLTAPMMIGVVPFLTSRDGLRFVARDIEMHPFDINPVLKEQGGYRFPRTESPGQWPEDW